VLAREAEELLVVSCLEAMSARTVDHSHRPSSLSFQA
jgi:hypothetical protein